MLLHSAIVLKIVGFALATLGGGILLNRDIFERFASKLDKKITDTSITLTDKGLRRLLPLLRFSTFVSTNEITKQMLAGISGRGIAAIITFVGLIANITWLFWVGLVLVSPYALLTAYGTFMRLMLLSRKRNSWTYMLSYPVFLCWVLLLGFIIAPIALFLYLVFLYSLLLIAFSAATLSTSDNLKKSLIIFGSILVTIGLLIETVITW